MRNRIMSTGLVCLLAVGLAACASTGQVQNVERRVQAVEAKADSALQRAQAAEQAAQRAVSRAEAAEAQARAAATRADEAARTAEAIFKQRVSK